MAIPDMHRRVLFWIVLLGVLARFVYILVFIDLGKDYYWEYGEIARYLHEGKGYSYFSFDNGVVAETYRPGAAPLPSAFMAPGYVWFLTPFLSITSVWLRNLLILGIHILAGMLLTVAVYRLTKHLVDEQTALIAAALCAALPEFIYAVGSYTPTVFYHLGVVVLISLLYRMRDVVSFRATLAAGLVQSLLVYLRMEFFLFGLFAAVYIVSLRQWRQALLYVVIMVGVLIPWAVRNEIVFGEFVPFTTGGGLNLFRGHNSDEIGAWEDSVTSAQIGMLPSSRSYEVERNRVYVARVLQFVREHPEEEFHLALEKFIGLWFWNSRDPRSTHPLHLISWGLTLLFAGFGLRRLRPLLRHAPIFLFLAYSTCLALAFYVLPRYQTMMKIGLIPLAAAGISALFIKKAA